MNPPDPQQSGETESTTAVVEEHERLKRFHETLLHISRCQDRESAVSQFAAELSSLLDFQHCCLAFRDAEGQITFASPTSPDVGLTAADKQMITQVLDQQVLHCLQEESPAQSVLCLPLLASEKTLGAVLIRSRSESAFTQNDVQFAQSAVEFFSIAYDRLHQMEALTHTKSELRIAWATSHHNEQKKLEALPLVRKTDTGDEEIDHFDQAMYLWAEQARNHVEAHQCKVSYIPYGIFEEGIHAVSLSEKYQEYEAFDAKPTGAGIWSLVINEQRSFCLTDAELTAHPAWRNFSEIQDEQGRYHPPLRGWLAVPIVSRENKAIGIVQLSDKYTGDFTHTDLDKLKRLARLLAPAFALQYANDEVLRQREQLAEATEVLEQKNRELQELADRLTHEQYLLNSLVENIPDPVFFKDAEGRFIRVNQAMARDAGFSDPAELIGKSDRDIWSGELPAESAADERRIMETGEPVINKIEQPIAIDGPFRWVLVSKLPLRDAGNEIIGTFGIAREFTERKLMEDELQALNEELNSVNLDLGTANSQLAVEVEQAELARERAEEAEHQLEALVDNLRDTAEMYHKLIDNLPVCATRKDNEGRVSFVNRAFCEFVGTSAERIIGKTDHDLFPAELADKYRADDIKVMQTRKIMEWREKNVKEGKPRDVNVVKTPWFDESGTTQGVLVVFWDVTEQVRYEEQLRDYAAQLQEKSDELSHVNEALEQSNVELQQFAYIASHDLQTPLRGIAGFAQFLQRNYQNQLDERADGYIDRIVAGVKRMQQLINDLLVYSRVESRKAPFKPVAMNTLFDDTVTLLHSAIEQIGCTVSRSELPVVQGDVTQLGQLLQNLLGNALKYHSADAPSIHVSAEQGTDEWTFAVADNGIGIEPKFHRRIFEIFRRLHTEEEYPGTGIGLALCQRIVQRHGGKIWLESQVGIGTTFYFTIPHQKSE